jgi:hypothetical protein
MPPVPRKLPKSDASGGGADPRGMAAQCAPSGHTRDGEELGGSLEGRSLKP